MRAASLGRLGAGLALLVSLAFLVAADQSMRKTVEAKIDRAARLEQDAARPSAAARLEACLLERRLARVAEPGSQAVAAAFAHAQLSQVLADYRAAGGDDAIAAEAEKTLVSDRTPGPDAEIALMRAVRGLAAEASRAPRPARPDAPLSAAQARRRLMEAAAAGAAAVVLAYAAGRLDAAR